ncbi:alpha/beta hydrolase [Tunturibacter empetritectus]|uniref:Alpha/beta hydrolase n=1 Tax=Tunturiibacter empetritectus TaxID=3069691 RepID=A0AAU7ZFX2_9BACT
MERQTAYESDTKVLLKQSPGKDNAGLSLVVMPFLGGSWKEWAEVIELLSPRLQCVGIDLPGFGDAAEVNGYSVALMADYIIARLKTLKLKRFVLAGHSMAGKVSMVVALRAKNDPELAGLAGLVLVASSPASPEPMSDDKRTEMQARLGKPGNSYRKHAEKFIQENSAQTLPSHVFTRAVSDVLRMNCAAWNAWLDSGSKEDWAERVGELNLPALVVAGDKDKALGFDAQAKLVMPHLPHAQLKVLAGAAHLLPMERPQELAKLIADFADRIVPDFERRG